VRSSFTHAFIQVDCIAQHADALATVRAVNACLVAPIARCTATKLLLKEYNTDSKIKIRVSKGLQSGASAIAALSYVSLVAI
jgi:hypothetical protein